MEGEDEEEMSSHYPVTDPLSRNSICEDTTVAT